MRYCKPEAGQWVQPIRRRYKLACCDCGLVHRMDFRLVTNDRGPGKKIQFRAYRDERATAAMRREDRKRSRKASE